MPETTRAPQAPFFFSVLPGRPRSFPIAMSLLALLNHLLNFVAPALAVGFLCALAGRLGGARAGAPAWWVQGAINSAVGAAALLAGLVFGGRDGTMTAYAALVIASGTSQWMVSRGWRK